MKRSWIVLLLLQILCLSIVAIVEAQDKVLLMASTIGPVDAGIVPLLENRFEQETGIRVRHVSAGTGEALKMAEGGSFDIALVHAKSLEEKFVSKGFGTERIPLMYNDFVILGPATDPARIKGSASASDALNKIRLAAAPFVTRGDKSGTHVAEMELWNKAGLKPEGNWYVVFEKGKEGNGPTLRFADQMGAYVFMDRATYLTLKDAIKLMVLVEKDEALLNYMSVIPVNPAKFPGVNYKDTQSFVRWLTAPDKGQRIIAEFGKEKYGTSLFTPNSVQWRAAQGK